MTIGKGLGAMTRDMDLVRKLLLAVESRPALAMVVIDATTMSGIDALALRLTWAGHEFLESVRDDSQWRSVKTQTEKAGGLVFDVIKAVASAAMLRQLGL